MREINKRGKTGENKTSVGSRNTINRKYLKHLVALHNHDLIAQSNKYLHLNAKVVIAVVELLDLMRYALSLSICFIYLLIVWEC